MLNRGFRKTSGGESRWPLENVAFGPSSRGWGRDKRIEPVRMKRIKGWGTAPSEGEMREGCRLAAISGNIEGEDSQKKDFVWGGK